MDNKLFADLLLSKEIELKEREADLLRIVGRLRQVGICAELRDRNIGKQRNYEVAETRELWQHLNKENTTGLVTSNHNDNFSGTSTALCRSKRLEEVLQAPNFDDFGVSEENLDLLELYKMGIKVSINPTPKKITTLRTPESFSLKPPTITSIRNGGLSCSPELFEKKRKKEHIPDFLMPPSATKLGNMVSPVSSPISIKNQLFQYSTNMPILKAENPQFDSMKSHLKKADKTYICTNLMVDFGKPLARCHSELLTPHKPPEEPSLKTPLLENKQLLDALNLQVPASPVLASTKWL